MRRPSSGTAQLNPAQGGTGSAEQRRSAFERELFDGRAGKPSRDRKNGFEARGGERRGTSAGRGIDLAMRERRNHAMVLSVLGIRMEQLVERRGCRRGEDGQEQKQHCASGHSRPASARTKRFLNPAHYCLYPLKGVLCQLPNRGNTGKMAAPHLHLSVATHRPSRRGDRMNRSASNARPQATASEGEDRMNRTYRIQNLEPEAHPPG